ncbi:MAG: UDP-N-acetylmuramoyl-L-alanyl-D-glutamate--2,6-diaminopimelate ligase [Endomicrobia bacterium]|nr:UDP-N-acetylmuramoyl-L-alanyl-D-glutamate--2,6-diaminopimelate ligase [Endomicrobiia bacterium]
MKLKDIPALQNAVIYGDENTEIHGVSYDSRSVKKGDIFFALPGHQTDGKKFIQDAISKGAVAVVTEKKDDNISVVQIVTGDIFKFMPEFCAEFYNHPDREMTVVAITGTNGKTTITYMIESILEYCGIQCGVIGTVNYRYAGKVFDAPNTTPQSADVYRMMREMADSGIKYLVMEVSSHALALGRVDGIDFDIAVFTNLTQDHLDLHKNMESYFDTKSMLFTGLGKGTKNNTKYAIINADDKYGKKLSKISINAEKIMYGAKSKDDASFKAENISVSGSGSGFDLTYGGITEKIEIKHIGLHNVYNALASLASCLCCGIDFKNAVMGLNKSVQAPGRLEKIDTKNSGFEIAVDYAHTDDALKNVLSALRDLKPKRVITVFGCGGDRDRTKRPVMGKVAAEMSDFVFVTSDNPRSENPSQIILDIEVGIKRAEKSNYKVVVDREEAIKEAVVMAQKGDIILLAGKGHETYQIIGTQKVHFNDMEVAKKYLELREKILSSKQAEQKEFDF